jgi:23S rRNA pseudouridine2605 synthase
VKNGKRFGLARALSKMGYCSRAQATVLVGNGRVSLNGRVVRDAEAPVRMEQDRIAVDGAAVDKLPKVYLAMNKPRGVVTSTSDEKGRRAVYDLLPPEQNWLGPVGRLDKASEGLLLLTNDSEWAARITDPASHLEKSYHVQINCLATEELLRALAAGVRDGGEPLRARASRLLRHGRKNSWLEIVLDEGKNRHIRRLLAVLGVEVLRLVRVSIGPMKLGDLKKGTVRPLTAFEKQSIDKALREENQAKNTTGACR